MERLQRMIEPTIGVFSNIGDAHQQHFSSIAQKVQEKMRLFSDVETLVYCSDYQEIDTEARKMKHTQLVAWGTAEHVQNAVSYVTNAGETSVTAMWKKKSYSFTIPFTDSASIENAIHCFYVLQVLGVEYDIEKFKENILDNYACAHMCIYLKTEI